MTILYFSSTGNCLYVAKQLGGERYSIPKLIEEKHYEFRDEAVGIVFPVYGLCIPPFIEKYLREVTIDCNYLFAIATYGFFPGAVCREVSNITLQNGRRFDYINTVKMAENCITFADMGKQTGDSDKQQKAIDAVICDITNRRKYVKKESGFRKYMTSQHKKDYEYPTGVGITHELYVKSNCTGCGTCEKMCPMNNIRISGGKPSFGVNCVSCGACIQNCPSNAMHHNKEKSGDRYRNPHIDIKELLMR